MKTFLSLTLVLFSWLASTAQPSDDHHHQPLDVRTIRAILATASKPTTALGFTSVSEARSIISEILEQVDVKQNFTIIATHQVDNAAAVTYQNQRYILYNPSFINKLDDAANDRWASISVLGHEIGHHLLGHTMDGSGSQLHKELEADEFSGYVLHKMGASLGQAQIAMKLISPTFATATHPGEADRLAAISKGWNMVNGSSAHNRRDVAIDTRPAPRQTTYERPRPTTHDRTAQYPARNSQQKVVYQIHFTGGTTAKYYITSHNNVIRYNGQHIAVVGKIGATNQANIPYVIYDDSTQMYVDKKGNIYSNRGTRIGLLTRA